MGIAHINVESRPPGSGFDAQPIYLCCERGLIENGCIHHPRGMHFNIEDPAHVVVATLMKHLDKLGRRIRKQKDVVQEDGKGGLILVPDSRPKKTRRLRRLV